MFPSHIFFHHCYSAEIVIVIIFFFNILTRIFWQASSYSFSTLAFLLNWSILVTCKTITEQQIHQHHLNFLFKLRFSILDNTDLYFPSQQNTPCKQVLICEDFKIKAEKKRNTVTVFRTTGFQSHASPVPSATEYTTSSHSFIRSVIPKQY